MGRIDSGLFLFCLFKFSRVIHSVDPEVDLTTSHISAIIETCR